jgi:hypothetical protein
MKTSRKTIAALILVLLILPAMAACSLQPDKVTRENYDKLELGMSFEEVSAILGEPATFSTWLGIKQYTWVEKGRHIHAKFLADSAVYYSCKNLGEDVPKGSETHAR